MREKRIHFLAVVAVLILVFMFSAACVWAQGELVWEGYHKDATHKGQNAASSDITKPEDLNLIWAFPRTGQTSQGEVVDDDSSEFRSYGLWRFDDSMPAAADAWNGAFLRTSVVSREKAAKINPGKSSYAKSEAVWFFPAAKMPYGVYRIWVWVPPAPKNSGIENTSQAEYTVFDDSGAVSVKFDQRDGGYWKLLTDRSFVFSGSSKPTKLGQEQYYVSLTDVTDDTDDNMMKDTVDGLRVVADAIRFEPSTGMEIYSSPASLTDQFGWAWTDPVDSTVHSESIDNAPFVYVGTVESPLTGGAPDTGTVYCINSATPPISHDPFEKDNNGDYVNPDDEKWRQLGDHVATPRWQYPRSAKDRLDNGLELEGPIEGGVYSSPALGVMDINGDGTAAADEFVCIVTGMDRQTYAFDARTGDLLWKGPGVTLSEGDPAGWTTVDNGGSGRPDAFGGKYHFVTTDTSGADAAEWNFAPKLQDVIDNVAGLSYAVYAWIPAQWASDPARCRDARYEITYIADGQNVTETVTVDQSLQDNQARWVRLGSSFWQVQKVALLTDSQDVDGDGKPIASAVVADAVMIVPEDIGAFGYCSPVFQADGLQAQSRVFAVSGATGRAMSFDLKSWNKTDHIGKLKWIYPNVRTTSAVTGPTPSGMGEVGASPAYHNGAVYVAAYDGRVHCINALGIEGTEGTAYWVWEDSSSSSGSGDGDDPTFPINDGVHFTSSPTIDEEAAGAVKDPPVYVASTDGQFICLHGARTTNDSPDAGTVVWRYPDKSGMFPLQGFRYSTPAIAEYGNLRRAWVAGSGGKIYSFDLNPSTDEHRLWLDYDDDGNLKQQYGAQWYAEPSAGGPVQASIAIDGTSAYKPDLNMYVGNMSGTLRWFNAKDGSTTWGGSRAQYKGWNTEAEYLFSSPNLTHLDFPALGADKRIISYLYVGGSDGRVYAFSRADGGAWGGSWIDSIDWPFEGEQDSNDSKQEEIGSDPDVQFDIFDNVFYSTCIDGNINVEPMHATDYLFEDPREEYAPLDWDTLANDFIVSSDMKLADTASASEFTSGSSPYTQHEVDEYLKRVAKERRSNPHLFPSINARTTANSQGKKEIYFEWGETINLVLWNLPKLELLYGSNEKSKRSNIRFYFRNQSPGSSAGSSLTLAGLTKVLREYTVLDKSKPVTVSVDDTNNPGNTRDITGYEPLKYTQGGDDYTAQRCFAVAQIDLKGTGSRPPSPGPGWVLTAEFRRKSSTAANATTSQVVIPLALLNPGNPPKLVLIPSAEGGTADTIKEQEVGINNPLALRYGNTELGFDIPANGATNRFDLSAHFNGNSTINAGSNEYTFDNSQVPVLDMGDVRHGTSSPQLEMVVADRSAVGCSIIDDSDPLRPKTDSLQRFRINAGDLRWPHRQDARIMPLPWEDGPGSSDYPDIFKRYQDYRKASDDADPSRQATTLPPVRPVNIYNGTASYDEAQVRPDVVFSSVSVPRFQPANLSGYYKSMQAYVDSDGDRNWDSGDSILGRPSTYQEAYRKFGVGLKVPPDPRIEVEEQLVDLGRAPHGLGEFIPSFNAFNTSPDVTPWFKSLTVKNSGNVNLAHLRVGKNVPLLSDSTNQTYPMPGVMITSSLDGIAPFDAPPFTTSWNGTNYGYTLTKPRVGDPDPTVLTVPDRRKWDLNFDDGSGIGPTRAAVDTKIGPTDNPLTPEVGVRVPLSQPIGSYQAPYVPVAADVRIGGQTYTPVADPTFQLKVTVRENQLTGGASPATIPQIDPNGVVTLEDKIGDATPAAFKDPNTGNVFLFWSSNRMTDRSMMPSPTGATDNELAAFANAPWFIYRAELGWDLNKGGWQLSPDTTTQKWWDMPGSSPFMPSFQWPSQLLAAPAGSAVMPWTFPGADSSLMSVRHHSPVVAENLDTSLNSGVDRNWLAWVGTANISSPNSEQMQEHRIFYTDVTGGKVRDNVIMSIEHDPEVVKRSPSMEVYGSRMWMFWQAGTKGNWSIFYSVNDDGPEHPIDAWSSDLRLRTPECLAAVSGPNAIHRVFWHDLIHGDTTNAKHLLDVTFAGTTKITQNSDIMLSRYAAVATGDKDANGDSLRNDEPSRRAQPLPRVFGQQLRRDPQYGFFTAQHLAWVRMGKQNIQEARALIDAGYSNVLIDYPDRESHLALEPAVRSALTSALPSVNPETSVFYNLPYIWVRFPKGTIFDDGDAIVSGTDGSITKVSDDGSTTVIVAPQPILPEVDDASGVYTYRYPKDAAGDPALTTQAIGEMLVDFSAGIVRFTAPLTEVREVIDDKEVILSPEVYADYTPQTWRLTTDESVDNSPRAFLERTPMVKDDPNTTSVANDGPNPSMMDWSSNLPKPEIDRLWVLWRKAGTGVDSSTIFYKTYRVGVDLVQLGLPPIPMSDNGTIDSGANLTVSNNNGPWEVDRTGTKIYFTEVDERYRSLARSGSEDIASAAPGPITIEYRAQGTSSTKQVDLYDVYWIEETPEQSLFGYAAEGNVNEGSIYAFADPEPMSGTLQPLLSSKIWVFWTSTRAGTSDLFWETVSPNFMAR